MRHILALCCGLGACGPGVDEPDVRRRGFGEACSYDLQCRVELICVAGICAPEGDYFLQWGSEAPDYGASIGITSEGVYVAGGTFGGIDAAEGFGSEDIFVTHFAADGQLRWTAQWGTPSFESAYSLVPNADGSMYLGGPSHADLGPGTYGAGTDVWVSRLSAAGGVQETWQWGTPGNEWAVDLVSDGESTLYVVGRTDGDLGGESGFGQVDAFAVRMSADGSRPWTRILGTGEADGALTAALGPEGSLYMAGETGAALPQQSYAGDLDVFVARYANDGTRTWLRQWGTRAKDRAFDITADDAGNIYLTGQTGAALHDNVHQGEPDIFLMKIAPDGARLWTQQWGSELGDAPAAVTLDAQGQPIVVAAILGAVEGLDPQGKTDILLSKLTPEGKILWSRVYGGPEDDVPADVACSGPWTYVTGSTASALNGPARGFDNFLLMIRD